MVEAGNVLSYFTSKIFFPIGDIETLFGLSSLHLINQNPMLRPLAISFAKFCFSDYTFLQGGPLDVNENAFMHRKAIDNF